VWVAASTVTTIRLRDDVVPCIGAGDPPLCLSRDGRRVSALPGDEACGNARVVLRPARSTGRTPRSRERRGPGNAHLVRWACPKHERLSRGGIVTPRVAYDGAQSILTACPLARLRLGGGAAKSALRDPAPEPERRRTHAVARARCFSCALTAATSERSVSTPARWGPRCHRVPPRRSLPFAFRSVRGPWHRPLMEAFRRAVREQPAFRDTFGVIQCDRSGSIRSRSSLSLPIRRRRFR
jgi:hypothetical protein